MPQRFLKPGITNSERWNGVSWAAQSLYIRLLTVVDDYGRYDGRSAVVHGNCFSLYNAINPERPVNLQETDKMLQEIAASGLIELYEVNGKRVVQITQWTERLRDGVKEKWPARNNAELLQLPAKTCKNLPSSSPPTSAIPIPPSNSSLALEVESQKPVETIDTWIESLQRSDAYKEFDVKAEYSKAGFWCLEKKRKLTKRFFLGWLNRKEKSLPVPTNGNGHGKLSPIDKTILLDNRRQAEARLSTIRNQYDAHQSWTLDDRQEAKELKNRIEEINSRLGCLL